MSQVTIGFDAPESNYQMVRGTWQSSGGNPDACVAGALDNTYLGRDALVVAIRKHFAPGTVVNSVQFDWMRDFPNNNAGSYVRVLLVNMVPGQTVVNAGADYDAPWDVPNGVWQHESYASFSPGSYGFPYDPNGHYVEFIVTTEAHWGGINPAVDRDLLDACIIDHTPPPCPGSGNWDEDAGKCAYNYAGVDAKTYASIEEYKGAYNPNPNFCVYRYPDSSVNPCGAPPEATDCANFVSQALLYGGLPLTDDWYAEDGIDTFQWAGAEDTSGLPSYLRWLVSGDPNDRSIDIRTNGQVWVDRANTGRIIANLDWIFSHGSQDPNNQTIIEAVGEALWTEGIRIGDILYAITNGLEHVALIVAWGPYVTTWNEIYNMNTAALPTERDSSNPVPYVIDHGNHVLNANPKPQVWAAGPKPYYALWWAPPNETSPGNFDERENADSAAQPPWGFIHIPSIVLFPPEQVREPWFDDKSEILA